MTQETKDFAFLHVIVLIWGFTAILGMLIQLPTVEMVFYRTVIAALALAILLILQKKSFRFRVGRDYLVALGTGFLIAAHWILFFISARISNVSLCLAGMATCSLWTSFLEPLVLKRKIRLYEVVLSIVGFMGIVVIFNVEMDRPQGLLLAMLAAGIAAVFTVINGNFTKREDSFVITFYEMCGAALGTALFFPVYMQMQEGNNQIEVPTWSDWLYLLVLGLICTVFAYSYAVRLMRRLSAYSVNLTVNLEPVYGMVLALIFFPEREKMTSGFYLGTGLILASVLIYPIITKSIRRKALNTDIWR